MDSRIAAADLAGGNRELLQTLAIEASTVLENARLLEEERGKQQMEEELRLARTIQQSLLPREAAGGRAGCAPAAAASRRTRWAAITYDVTRGEPALLGRGGGRCFRERAWVRRCWHRCCKAR